MSDKERKGIRQLQDALINLVMEASDEEILAELEEDGLEPDQEAEAMRLELAHAAGRARMAVARSKLERWAMRGKAVFAPAAANDVGDARRLTMAARNGSEQTEADVQSAAEDLRDISRHQAQEETGG